VTAPKPRKATPTARTLEELRRRGWPGQTVEKWVTMRGDADRAKEAARARLLELLFRIEQGRPAFYNLTGEDFREAISVLFKPAPAVRKDFLGCIDILAMDGLPGSLGIQACAGGDASTRAKKAATEPLLRPWLAAGNRFQVWAWREIWVDTGAKTKAKRWRPRIVCLVLVDGEIVDMELEAGSDGRTPAGASLGAGLDPRATIPPPGPAGSGPAPGLF
jgi:hypothetical protein